MLILIDRVISTSNHMFKREIWDKFGKFQITSGKFQTNAINDVKQISLSHVMMIEIIFYSLKCLETFFLKKAALF